MLISGLSCDTGGAHKNKCFLIHLKFFIAYQVMVFKDFHCFSLWDTIDGFIEIAYQVYLVLTLFTLRLQIMFVLYIICCKLKIMIWFFRSRLHKVTQVHEMAINAREMLLTESYSSVKDKSVGFQIMKNAQGIISL